MAVPRFEIHAPGWADVCVACAPDAVPWQAVEILDNAGIRAVCAASEHVSDDVRHSIARRCAGVLSVAQDCPQIGAVSHLRWDPGDPGRLQDWLGQITQGAAPPRAYALFVGRLERDFDQARHAIRAAVETQAGVPCLWVDSRDFSLGHESVRARTKWLISNAVFLIGDLTLGPESPKRENPSRAHEIGMAEAFGKPVMLTSQEPRRYPYYSVIDHQMTFWQTEAALYEAVSAWIAARCDLPTLRVLNHELGAPAIAAPSFAYDPERRFVGPNLRRGSVFFNALRVW